MKASVWTTRCLSFAAAIFLAVGLVLRVAPPNLPPVGLPAPTAARAAALPPPAAEPPGITTAIATGDIFSASRTPPRVRYTPPDLLPARRSAPTAAARRGPAPPRLRLFGTVVGSSGTAALIDADSAIRGAEIYQVGDEVEGQRIVAVSESTVVLEGAAGRTVLRLQPPR
jgi:hypothetical protein